ncbi:hypothetical protein [Candidatus Palauibacter sp.]|uniref:hypothetical protein n=1 Tax=Candidatus Palauibacter sp. TaxID=3101350 RepID=UPI003B5AE6E8
MAELDLTRSEHRALANRLCADKRGIEALREDAEKLRARAKTTAGETDWLDFEEAGGSLHRFEDLCSMAANQIARRIEQHRHLGGGKCPECEGALEDGCEDGCRYD